MVYGKLPMPTLGLHLRLTVILWRKPWLSLRCMLSIDYFGKIAFVCCLCEMAEVAEVAEIRPTICNLVYDMTSLRKAQFCNAGWPRFGLQVATLYLLQSIWSVCNSAILPTKWYLVPPTPRWPRFGLLSPIWWTKLLPTKCQQFGKWPWISGMVLLSFW